MTTILIIGAGFGGISAALELHKRGFDSITILERATTVGGVWAANRYPGARSDNPSALYSLSGRPAAWSERYADRSEIHDYLRSIAGGTDIGARIRFGEHVVAAEFDESGEYWRVRTAAGREYLADVVISAVGQLSEPRTPDIPGSESFAGIRFHSAQWNDDTTYDDRSIGVIGTGASAAQVIPWLQKRARTVTVFQRSAAWVLPKSEVRYSALRRKLVALWPIRQLERGLVFAACELLTLSVTRLPVVGRIAATLARAGLRTQVKDPELRRRLTPDYPLGGKRCLFSDEYFRALSSPNVRVETAPIERLTPDGVVTTTGTTVRLDTIVYCTGFRPSEFLSTVAVHGRHGARLSQAWAEGAGAYLGMTVPKFPNLFLMAGPNTNLVFGSIVFMLECQARHIGRLLTHMRATGAGTVEVRDAAYLGFAGWMRRQFAGSVWSRTDSPYRDHSGVVTSLWPSTMTRYRWMTRNPRTGSAYLFA